MRDKVRIAMVTEKSTWTIIEFVWTLSHVRWLHSYHQSWQSLEGRWFNWLLGCLAVQGVAQLLYMAVSDKRWKCEVDNLLWWADATGIGLRQKWQWEMTWKIVNLTGNFVGIHRRLMYLDGWRHLQTSIIVNVGGQSCVWHCEVFE
jgi:hypothetical protein